MATSLKRIKQVVEVRELLGRAVADLEWAYRGLYCGNDAAPWFDRAHTQAERAALAAMTEAKDRLLCERDEYMDRFGLLLPWLVEHVQKHDSDVVDIDHGPIVEWDYCDWCEDYGLPSDWPCVFARAANPALAATAPQDAGEE